MLQGYFSLVNAWFCQLCCYVDETLTWNILCIFSVKGALCYVCKDAHTNEEYNQHIQECKDISPLATELGQFHMLHGHDVLVMIAWFYQLCCYVDEKLTWNILCIFSVNGLLCYVCKDAIMHKE